MSSSSESKTISPITLKCLVIGHGSVGKTQYINRVGNSFTTNKGLVKIEYTETILLPTDKKELHKYHSFIVMSDSTSFTPFMYTDNILKTLHKEGLMKKVMLCNNKCDLINADKKRMTQAKVSEHTKENKEIALDLIVQKMFKEYPGLTYYDISAVSNYNIEKPTIFTIRSALGEDSNFISVSEDKNLYSLHPLPFTKRDRYSRYTSKR